MSKKNIEEKEYTVNIEAVKAHESVMKQKIANFFKEIIEKGKAIPAK